MSRRSNTIFCLSECLLSLHGSCRWGEVMLIEKEDHLSILHGLARVCGSHGWRVDAWVLMGNYFQLLPETLETNLVARGGALVF